MKLERFPVCDDDKRDAEHFPVVERLLTMRFPELRCVTLRFKEKQRLLGFLAPPHQDVYETSTLLLILGARAEEHVIVKGITSPLKVWDNLLDDRGHLCCHRPPSLGNVAIP